MTSEFQHVRGDEQIRDLSITTNLLADGAVSVQKMNINGNLNFNEFQALEFRLENVSSTPAAGNAGRLIWNTTLQEALIDTGSVFQGFSGLTPVNFVIGEDLTSQVGGTTFTLAFTPTVNTEAIYVNGIRQRRGIGNDYTISGDTITFSYIPEFSSDVLADYLK